MRVSTLINDLVNAELAGLSVSNQDIEGNTDTILSYVTRAVNQLNTEFMIRERSKTITLVDGQQTYSLGDSDMVLITSAYDQDNNELSLNEEGNDFSVFTTAEGIVQYQGNELHEDKKIDSISLIYIIEFDDVTSGTVSIPLNAGLRTALMSYVGYLANSAVNMAEGSPSISYKIQYDREVTRLKQQGFNARSVRQLDKFTERGFV